MTWRAESCTSPKDPTQLDLLNWEAIGSRDFRDLKTKEGKQAEFLVFNVFPWTLIEKIGIINGTIEPKVQAVLATAEHQPAITIEPSWYF
jgi:hypothetical protein